MQIKLEISLLIGRSRQTKYIYIYIYTVSHRREYTPHICVNILTQQNVRLKNTNVKMCHCCMASVVRRQNDLFKHI